MLWVLVVMVIVSLVFLSSECIFIVSRLVGVCISFLLSEKFSVKFFRLCGVVIIMVNEWLL